MSVQETIRKHKIENKGEQEQEGAEVGEGAQRPGEELRSFHPNP
jgi:hypothetical protein